MTKKEAIKILDEHAMYCLPSSYIPALEMAIAALEKRERSKIYARVPTECKEYLRKAAEKRNITMTEYLERLIVSDMRRKNE